MKITFVFLLLVLGLLKISHQQCLSPNDSASPHQEGITKLYTGQQAFSLALLQAINQLMPNENLCFSPYSTYHALLVAYFLSGGKTESSLKKILRLETTQTKLDFYQAYKLDNFLTNIRKLNSSYASANKIYVADQIVVRPCVSTLFEDELSKAPFKTDPQGARLTINNWMEQQTHNMIKDLLPPASIHQSTTLALVNAAYFKGKWKNKFNPMGTKREIFYVNLSKQILVDMMHVEDIFNHGVSENLEAHVLEMPYDGDQISMYVFLPPFSKEDAIDNTLKKLTVDEFQNIVNSDRLNSNTVQVSFPKFSLEHTIELVPVLEKMGIGDLFQNQANLTVLSKDNVSLRNALHKSKIEVNEDGTKEAFATALLIPVQFRCNHPFIYIIFDKVQKAILFNGVFGRPH